jgi:stringent starvation protein B
MEYVKNNEIVLNVGFEATSGLKLGNDFIEFRARFGGMARDILVPVDHVVAIYARENGQGMAFPMPTGDGEAAPVGLQAGPVTHSTAPAPAADGAPRGLRLAPAGTPGAASDQGAHPPAEDGDDTDPPDTPTPAPTAPRPALKRIK